MSSTVYDWGPMSEPLDPELPRAIALAWGVARVARSGPDRDGTTAAVEDRKGRFASSGERIASAAGT